MDLESPSGIYGNNPIGFNFGGTSAPPSEMSMHHHPSSYSSSLGFNDLLWSHLGIPPGALYSPTFLSVFPAIAAQMQQTLPWGNKLGQPPSTLFPETMFHPMINTMIPFDLSRQLATSEKESTRNSSPNPRASPYSHSSSPKIEKIEFERNESEAMDLAIKNNLKESVNSCVGTFSKEKSAHFLREKAKSLIDGTEGPMEVETEH